MNPGPFPGSRAAEPLRFATAATPLGELLAATSASGLRAVLLGDNAEELVADLQRRFPAADRIADDPVLAPTLGRLIEHLKGPRSALDLAIDPLGTDFQLHVWQALRAIPAGHTATYGEVATRIGRPRAVRAVASACAANPLALVIPCHRVLGSGGRLAGYRWGIELKRELLAREGSLPPGTRPRP
jgi:AraC family transcriptional regulator of adaptative response/methylated-DNA-[protein]-cysteine methyltransferase